MTRKGTPQTGFDFQEEIMDNSKVFKNFNQEFIVTTADKVKLCLLKHQKALRTQLQWLTPLGILIAFVIALVTADFKIFLGQDSSFWKALFVLSSILSFIWFIIEVIRMIVMFCKGEGSIENIIKELKKHSPKSVKESDYIKTKPVDPSNNQTYYTG